MRTVIICILISTFAISCKKTYQCDNGETISNPDPRFNQIKSGYTITDINGSEIHCY